MCEKHGILGFSGLALKRIGKHKMIMREKERERERERERDRLQKSVKNVCTKKGTGYYLEFNIVSFETQHFKHFAYTNWFSLTKYKMFR